MSDLPPEIIRGAPDAPTTLAVEFNSYVAGDYNRELGGKGTLTIRAEEPRFVFTGRPRKMLLLAKQPADVAFRSDQIWNATVHERGVSFRTAVGKCGAKKTPFVFTCASEAEAAVVVAQLPPTQDTEFQEGAEFTARVRQLPGGGASLGSVTVLLILANVATFIAMGFAGAGWFEVDSLLPYVRFGANKGAATAMGEWWRLVACMFLHFGLLHLLLNAWALFQVGLLVERLFGRLLFTLVYFGSGVLGSLATLHWNGDKVWSAGASGAVFGVYGALLGYLVREKQTVPRSVFQPLLKSTLVFAGFNLFYGAVHPNIDNAAHIGGFVAGALLGAICGLPLDLATRTRVFRSRLLTGATTLAAAVALGIATAPRFDYRITDELALHDTNQVFGAREKAQIAQRDQLFADFVRNGEAPALLAWLGTAASLYQQWHDAVTSLPLVPGLRTARERDALAAILAQRAQSYRRLATALRAGESDAIERFHDEDRSTVEAIAALHRLQAEGREDPAP